MNQHLSNLATPAGRAAYQEFWQDLTVHQHRSTLAALWQLWRSAAYGSELRMTASDNSYRIGHPLGARVGTRLFMQEIVVRHYFNNVQALVYLGAMILLVFLGLRFAGVLSETASLVGIGIEAFMLLILFTVLFYAPDDDSGESSVSAAAAVDAEDDDRTVLREVLHEVEDIGGNYASLGLKLEQLARSQEESMRQLAEKVGAIQGLNLLESHAERLETTNTLLAQLTSSIESMNRRIDMLFGKEIEFYVRQELERLVSRDTNGEGASRKPTERSDAG